MSKASVYTTIHIGGVRLGVHYVRIADIAEDRFQILSIHVKDDYGVTGDIWPVMSAILGSAAEELIVGALTQAREASHAH